YSQYRINYDLEGQMFVEFVIQNQLFSFSFEQFGQIHGVPYKGACSFFDKWSLDDLSFSVPTDGPYQTNPPSADDIKLLVQIERQGVVTRIRLEQEIVVEYNQILTREITNIMKTWVDIIQENIFCLGGNRDHVLGCLCHMLFCISTSIKYNFAYLIAKRMEFVTKQARLILPYGMLLTSMFDHIMSENPELSSHLYVLYDRVMYPLATQQERKTRKDYGTRRGRSYTSSSSTFGQPSSSHPNDDDNDGYDEGTSRASTPFPTRFVNSLTNEVPRVFLNPPNIDPNMEPFYTRQTEILDHTSSTFGTTSSLFESKPQSSPPSLNDTPSPQPSNPFPNDIMDASPRPSNIIPLQSHPSLDITLSLSPITPLDHILDTPSPPSPQPPPQPPLMGQPIYFNYNDYHGSTCLCCFHNRNLFFTLRDEMNLMFANLEYLLTSAIASPSPPHP
ncbi:hypothetical protein Tco_0630529, partial [Tanacetum coccineum]